MEGCEETTTGSSDWSSAATEEEPDGRDNFKRLLAYATKDKYSFLTILFKTPPPRSGSCSDWNASCP